MTIPTTTNAITETPAKTPKPIGKTSNFFPGGSKGAAAAPAFSAPAVGDAVGVEELDDWSKGTVEDGGKVTSGRSVLSGCEVILVLLGGDNIELVTSGGGAEVSVSEITGGRSDPELAGGELVVVEPGRTVSEGTPVLTGGLTIENPSVELSGVPPAGGSVLVLLGGITSDVEKNGSLELVEVAGGGRALESPSSGVTIHVLSSLTLSIPCTTIGVRVIVHV